jgi:transcriptional regulator with XRE-family HTH domain
MTEQTAAAFQREGEDSSVTESTEDETSADSQSEDENKEGDTQSPGGETSTQGEAELPFHEHPRWKERESEWDKRFNDQEVRHQDDLKAIREEFGTARKDNAEQTKIPVWFGGTQEQWDAYRADRDAELKSAADAAIERLNKDRDTATQTEEKKVAEATNYLRSEIAAIESDKTLNPSGTKIDEATTAKLLKVVLDNQLIDTQQRWNYRAGWKILNGSTATPAPKPKPPVTTEKKDVADATIDKGGSGETKTKTYMTGSDFKKPGARPW